MTDQDADEAFEELCAEIDDFLALLYREIGPQAGLIAASHPGLHTRDPRGRPLLMPRFMVLATLCEHPSARTKPSHVVASDWEERYLAIDAVSASGNSISSTSR